MKTVTREIDQLAAYLPTIPRSGVNLLYRLVLPLDLHVQNVCFHLGENVRELSEVLMFFSATLTPNSVNVLSLCQCVFSCSFVLFHSGV